MNQKPDPNDPLKKIIESMFNVNLDGVGGQAQQKPNQTKPKLQIPTPTPENIMEFEPIPAQYAQQASPGSPEQVLIDAHQGKHLVDESTQISNSNLHKDWNRCTALINEMSCGNNSTRASLSYFAYGIASGIVKLIEDYRTDSGLPSPLSEVLELAAIETIRSQIARKVSQINPDHFNAVLDAMRKLTSPK